MNLTTRWRMLLAAFLLAFVAWCAAPLVASAADVDPGDTVAELRLSALAVSLLVAAVIPIVNGIATTAALAAKWKALITLALNALNALIVNNTVGDGSLALTEPVIITWLIGFVISVGMYLGIYKPFGVTSSTTGPSQPDPKLFPNFGIGPSPD